MASAIAADERRSGAVPLPRWRWFFLVFLLLVELISLAVLLFDVGNAATRTDWISTLLGPQPRALTIGAIVAAAVALMVGRVLQQRIKILEPICAAYHEWPFLLVHGIALVGFVQVTAWVLQGQPSSAHPWVMFLWCLLAGTALVFWALCLLPASVWHALLPSGLGIMAAGVGIGFASWLVSQWSTRLWNPLGGPTVWLVGQLLALVNPQVIVEPANYTVGPPEFTVEIAPACSGYEGLGLISVFLAVALWVFRDRLQFPRAWLLFPIGLVMMWLANCVRLAALVMIGTWWSQGIALRGFHSQAGWLAFNLVAVVLIVWALQSRWFARGGGTNAVADRSGNPTAAYLMPILAMLATTMVATAFSEGDARKRYPVGAIAAAAALLHYRHAYREWKWDWSFAAIGFGATIFLIWIGLPWLSERVFGSAGAQVATESVHATGGLLWKGLRVAGYVLLTPLIEELAFRGFLLRRLISRDFQAISLRDFTWVSFLGSSLLFGVAHGSYWIPGTLAGMAYAAAARRRGALSDAVLAHGTTNALLALCAGLFGDWSLIS